MAGGGVGILMAQRSPDEKSTGIMQHAVVYDAMTGAYRQRSTRRGSAAVYADITTQRFARLFTCETQHLEVWIVRNVSI